MEEELRSLSRDMHAWMTAMVLTMLWMHWIVLDYMVTFCATMPILGALAHLPLIATLWGQAHNAILHLKCQRAMIKARLV